MPMATLDGHGRRPGTRLHGSRLQGRSQYTPPVHERDLGEEFLPPSWVSIPLECAAETALVECGAEKGAIAGAVLNRRATIAIGETIATDLQGQLGVPGRVIPIRA